MNNFDLNRIKWARTCLAKFMTSEEAKKVDYGLVVCAAEWLQEILNVTEGKPKYAARLEDTPSVAIREKTWAPKVSDRVKVVSLAPLERLRKTCASFAIADLRLSDEGTVVREQLNEEDFLFEVHFSRLGQTVICNQEMVQPYDEACVDLRKEVSSIEVRKSNGVLDCCIASDSASRALLGIANRMGWRSLSYIDTEHEFPVTEVWREE
jgi:hypothetical protein